MKIKLLSALVVGLLSVSAYAQTITIPSSGWQLLGATEEINITKFNEAGCVDYVWKYDHTDTSNPWRLHIANGINYDTASNYSPILESIGKGQGYWLKGNENAPCNINNTVTSSVSTASTFVSGKTITIDPEYPTTMIFSYDGSYSEGGFNGSNQTDPYLCTGKWLKLSTNKVAMTCDNSGTSPTSSNLAIDFGTETIINGTNITIYPNGTSGATVNTTVTSVTSPSIFVSGKTIAIDSDYPTTMQFSENGNYRENGYNGAGQTQPYLCTGKWEYLSEKTVAVTCENGGTTQIPTSSDLTFVFASETIATGMNVSIYKAGLSGLLTETTAVIPVPTLSNFTIELISDQTLYPLGASNDIDPYENRLVFNSDSSLQAYHTYNTESGEVNEPWGFGSYVIKNGKIITQFGEGTCYEFTLTGMHSDGYIISTQIQPECYDASDYPINAHSVSTFNGSSDQFQFLYFNQPQ